MHKIQADYFFFIFYELMLQKIVAASTFTQPDDV